MARNYTIAEAVQIIAEGQDNEALIDLGKRYPLLTQKITKVATKAGADFVDLMSFMPEHISANKINSSIKRMLEAAEDADTDDVEEEAPKKPVKKSTGKAGRPKKVQDEEEEDDDDNDVEDSGSYDYESMNNAKMYKLLGELGKRKDCKEKYGDLSHDSMLKYLKKYGPKSGAADDVDEDEDEASSTDSYEGKSAVELYKLCKSRKIKAEQKKPAKYYIGLLKKADEEAAAQEDTDADDDEWDEEEDETPKKPAKKAPAKKAAKKPAKKAEPEEDDDDDDDEWEI